MHKFKEIAAKDDRLIHRLGKKIATEVAIKCRNKKLKELQPPQHYRGTD